MSKNETEAEETRGCIGLKTTVCANSVINVKRPESDRAHSVFVDESGDDAHEPDLTAETCQSPTSKEWCNGPANADDPERDTCILCECYADDVSNPGDELRASEGAEPTRTERADFGGGSSTGVEDL